MKNKIVVQTDIYSEIIVSLKLDLVPSATNAVSERSTFSLRRIKNWLRSAIPQERLNHSMLLSIHKEKTDLINLEHITNVFCEVNEERRRPFGIFCDADFSQLNVWSVDIFKKTNCQR